MLWHQNARVNSPQRWKQTRFRVCFHLWCELTSTMRFNRMTRFMEFMNSFCKREVAYDSPHCHMLSDFHMKRRNRSRNICMYVRIMARVADVLCCMPTNTKCDKHRNCGRTSSYFYYPFKKYIESDFFFLFAVQAWCHLSPCLNDHSYSCVVNLLQFVFNQAESKQKCRKWMS